MAVGLWQGDDKKEIPVSGLIKFISAMAAKSF